METCYSTDDEYFRYKDIGSVFDALESEGRFREGETYYEADFQPVEAKDVFSIDSLLENIDDELYGFVGEYAECWLFAEPNEVIKLQDYILDWISKNTNINKYYRIVGKSRPIILTKEDIDDYDT